MKHCNGQHDLRIVYSAGPSQMREVVRWCADCGAIVVDLDVDGRTMQPGGVMKMKFPTITKEKRNGQTDTKTN